jgi:hypothetical protein
MREAMATKEARRFQEAQIEILHDEAEAMQVEGVRALIKNGSTALQPRFAGS